MNLVELQKANEVRVYSRADNQKRTQLQLQVDNEQEYNLSYGQDAVLTILPLIEKEVKEMASRRNQHTKRFYWTYIRPIQTGEKTFQGSDTIERTVAGLVAVNLTSSLTKTSTLTSVAQKMANNAFHILHVSHELRKDENIHALKFFSSLVMFVAENTDIFTIDQVNGRENRLFLSDTWRAHVEEAQDNYKTNVSGYEPMVSSPISHTSLLNEEAGYLISKSPLLKHPTRTKERAVLESIMGFTAESNPDFFNYIDRVQKTEYVVNCKLLDVLSDYYYDRGISFKKFPILPDFDVVEEDAAAEIRKRNERRARYDAYKGIEQGPLTEATCSKIKDEHKAKMKDKVNKTKRLLEMANEYAVFERFWYPPFLDNRGRLYPYSSGSLSTQGDEMSKALIQFANKKTVSPEGMKALFHTLANTMGEDKKVMDEKLQVSMSWFAKNVPDFLEGRWDIFFEDSHSVKSRFDEPITALAVCIELTELAKDPNYKCGYINHRDARVSGSSIIGTAMRDKGIMEMTSVLDWNQDGKLGDAYTKAADEAMALCKKYADEGCELCATLLSYSEELFCRSVFKHVVMTWCSYGLTDFSLREYNKGVFKWDEELDKEHKTKFDNLMLEALVIALPACSRFLKVFRKVGAEVAKRDGRFSFINPLSQFPVAFTERKMKKERVEVAQPGRIIKLNIIVPTNNIDTMAITNAVAPNVIHSIDAALLYRVSHTCSHDLCFIHDSIGSHADDVEATVAAYAKSMMKVAQMDVLNNILEQLGVEDRLELVNTASDEDVGSIQYSKHVLV